MFLRYFAHELKFSSCSFPSGWRDALEEVGDDSFYKETKRDISNNYFVLVFIMLDVFMRSISNWRELNTMKIIWFIVFNVHCFNDYISLALCLP